MLYVYKDVQIVNANSDTVQESTRIPQSTQDTSPATKMTVSESQPKYWGTSLGEQLIASDIPAVSHSDSFSHVLFIRGIITFKYFVVSFGKLIQFVVTEYIVHLQPFVRSNYTQ